MPLAPSPAFLFSGFIHFNMALIQLVSLAMDVVIVVLILIFLYLLFERFIKVQLIQGPNQRQKARFQNSQEETLEIIAQEKALQISLLEDENKKLLAGMKKIRTDYAKGRASVTVYRKIMAENKEKIEDNKVRIKVLSK